MSNTLFRKVVASTAALSIVLSMVSPVVGVRAADTSIEAANRLASLGVIVDNSSDPSKYNLGSNITRREMLKIMMNLSSVEVGDTCEGKFADLPKSDWGCKYAEAALKAGFIAPNKRFRPNDMVTEAEALKMIMQARGVSKKEGVEPWSEAYRQAAVEAGILSADTKISNKPAKRSMVIVSADSAVAKTTGETAANNSEEDDLSGLLADLFGDEGAGSISDKGNANSDKGNANDTNNTNNTNTNASTGSTVTNDDLEVSLNPASPANGTSIPQSGVVKFAVVDFTAGKSDVSVNSVEIKKSGLFSVSTSTKAWFEINGRRVSGRSSFTSEGNVVLSFAPALVIKAGSTQTVDLVIELNGSSSVDYAFTSGKIDASTANVSGGFTTPTLRTTNYVVAGFSYTGASTRATYNVNGDEEYELGAFKITHYKTGTINETRDLDFKSITLYQYNSASLKNLKDLVLVRDGKVVSTEAIVDGKAVTFLVKDTIKDGASPIYYVKAKVATVENDNDYYKFYVKKSSDIVIYEQASGVRASATNSSSNEVVYSNQYTVKGADVSFYKDDTVPLSATYAPGTSNVVLMQGYIEAKQAVNLENPTLTLTVTNGSGAKLSDYFSTAYMMIGNTSLSASADSNAITTNSAVNKTLAFEGTATVNGKVPVKVYVNLKSTTNLPTATFKLNELTLSSFTGTKEYVSNGNTVTSYVGSVSARNITVGQSTLNITRNDGLGDTTIATGKKSVKVFGAQFSSTQGNPVRVSSITYEFTGSGTSTGFLNNATATLYVDGTAVKSKSITSTGIKFDGFNFDVSTSKSVNTELKVDFTDSFTNDKFTAKLTNITATDTVSSTVLDKNPNLVGATFTIADASATLALSNDTPKKALVTAGTSSVKLLTFRLTAKNDDINLKKITFSGSKLDSFNNFTLKDVSGKSVTASSASGTEIVFDNINSDTFVTKQDSSMDLSLYANAKTNTNTGTTLVGINGTEGLVIRGTNGAEITLTGTYMSTGVVSLGADVYENTAKIAQVSPVNKAIATDAMRFSITAAGKDKVTLKTISLSGNLANYAPGNYTLKVLKVSNNDVVASTGVTVNASGSLILSEVIDFNTATTVDAGKTETYYIKIENLITSDASKADWSISLKGLTVKSNNTDEFKLEDYPQNTDTLPLTSSK